jgi:competence protein ComEA
MKSAQIVLGALVVVASLSPAVEGQHTRRSEVTATEPAPPARPAKAPAPATDRPVNINTADVKGLMSLTGIGEKVAERIVAYRAANGPFKAPDDLRKVSGVGPGLLEKNRARIVVK